MLWSELNEEETNKMIKKALNHIEKNSEHSLSWQELKEEAKKMGYRGHENLEWSGLYTRVGDDNIVAFYKDGHIEINNELIISDRTPDQMFAIMKALQ